MTSGQYGLARSVWHAARGKTNQVKNDMTLSPGYVTHLPSIQTALSTAR